MDPWFWALIGWKLLTRLGDAKETFLSSCNKRIYSKSTGLNGMQRLFVLKSERFTNGPERWIFKSKDIQNFMTVEFHSEEHLHLYFWKTDALERLIVFTLTDDWFRVLESRCGFQFEVSNHFFTVITVKVAKLVLINFRINLSVLWFFDLYD